VGQAIGDFNMIEAGDKVMVCLSGGKDSYGLLDILLKPAGSARRCASSSSPSTSTRSSPAFPATCCPSTCQRGVPFHIENQDTYSHRQALMPEGKTMCSLCSRLRRGILYRVAERAGCDQDRAGPPPRRHGGRRCFLNMFFGGKLKGMPPKLVSDDGRHVVIRPLAYVAEKADLAALGRAPAASPSSPARCAAARRTCSASRGLSKTHSCCPRVGDRQPPYPSAASWNMGRWQAERLARALAGREAINVVYTSDLLRAWETARAVAESTGAPLIADEGLRERGFGAFQGKTFTEIEATMPDEAQRWRKRDPFWAPPGGESLTAMRRRVIETLHTLASRHRGEQIVMVAHGGVMDLLYRAATGQELQAPRTWQLGNTAINRLLWTPEGLTLVGWSDTSHLENESLDESTT
jgi:probable phosphoglycerate mutase